MHKLPYVHVRYLYRLYYSSIGFRADYLQIPIQYSGQHNIIYVQQCRRREYHSAHSNLLLLMLFFSPIAISIVGTFFFFLFISLICASVCPIRIGNITDPLSDTDEKTIRFSSTMDYDYSHNNTYLYFSSLFVLCHRTSLHHV